MRSIVFSVLVCISFNANAGCTYIAQLYTKSLYVDISDGGCGPLSISFTHKIGKDGMPDYATIKQYPFEEECILKIDKTGATTGFSCHANGRTPLAGATYKLKQFGFVTENCGYEGEKDHKIPDKKFVCTAGCKTAVPKALDEIVACD